MVKILCTADIHIGRRPSRLPSHVDTGPLSCARAWTALAERAIAERVDLVAIAGDVVDQANRFYEAAGPVEAGVRALAAQGIRTVAVAGNHDHDILPWIAGRFAPEELTLLGRGGRWERLTLRADGRPVLHVDGWSFPAARHGDDPLRDHPRHPADGVPVLGILHADLDQPGSRHAPVALAGLRSLPIDFWLLGHVHRHARYEQPGAATVLYPGSPQAMDPGEEGTHGAWLVEVESGGRFTQRLLPLSQVRYDTVPVDVTGVTEEGELGRRIWEAVSAELRRVEGQAGTLRYLSLRLRLTGRTPLHRTLVERWQNGVTDLEVKHEGMVGLVERVEVATRPQRDLEELARGQDAPAMLALLVRGLERDELNEEQMELLQGATVRAGEVRTARPHLPLSDSGSAVKPAKVQALLAEEALLLLDELLAQKEVT